MPVGSTCSSFWIQNPVLTSKKQTQCRTTQDEKIRQKEQAFMKQLNATEDRSTQPDDVAEIEVVLESTSCDFGMKNSS